MILVLKQLVMQGPWIVEFQADRIASMTTVSARELLFGIVYQKAALIGLVYILSNIFLVWRLQGNC